MPRALEAEHTLILGGTGAGKTTIVEALMDGAIRAGDRMLALDVKGEITARLPTDDCVLLSLDDGRSAVWRLGDDLRTPEDDAELSMLLIPETADPSWSAGARLVHTGLTGYLRSEANRLGKTWSWTDLHALLQRPVDQLHSLLVNHAPAAAGFIDVTRDETRKTALSFYLVLLANAGQAIASCARMGRGNEAALSIREWINNGQSQTLIIQQSQRQPDLSATLVRIILKLIADSVVTRITPTPVWLFLDEMPQIGETGDIPRLAAIGRSKGVRLVATAQSPAQIRDIYGPDAAQHLLDNLTTKVIGRVAPGATATEIAERWIGKRTIYWYENAGTDATGWTKRERRTEEVLVVEPSLLSDELGLAIDGLGRPVVRALVLGHGDVARLEWPVGRWSARRPETVTAESNPTESQPDGSGTAVW